MTVCPFCAGNEALTPASVYQKTDANGRWLVRIVPNKFPAVLPASKGSDPRAPDSAVAALGEHEVVVESPDHATDFAELPYVQFVNVLKSWRDRIAEHRCGAKWPIVLLFKNSGREAGASLEHVHSQIVALARIPQGVQAKLRGAAALYEQHRSCAFCRLIAAERSADVRMLIDAGGVVAMTAVAGRQPYETWVLPAEHDAAYDAQSDKQLEGVAAALARSLKALRQALPVCAYNLILHTAPFDTYWCDRYHWHIEIVPRISGLAGFELGAGEHINPVPPESAASELNRILGANDKLWLSEQVNCADLVRQGGNQTVGNA
jgi:UDPglucose--hexose-1-phosphate uridylyltransferase